MTKIIGPEAETKPRKKVLYFCDESSQNDDTYMAVAGIAVAQDAVPYILWRMKEIRDQYAGEKYLKPGSSEIKWKNAKYVGGMIHEGYIRLLFELVNEGRVHFHIRFSRMDEYDHKLSGPRKRLDTVSKAFYMLLLHRPVAFYGRKADLYIYPDDGSCTRLLPKQIHALNRDFSTPPVKLTQTRDSNKEPLLQLLDCTLGALAAIRNGRHENGDMGETKRRLCALAFELTKWPSIDGNCWKDKKFLNRWNTTPSIKIERHGRRG